MLFWSSRPCLDLNLSCCIIVFYLFAHPLRLPHVATPQMPVMDGIAATRAIRRWERQAVKLAQANALSERSMLSVDTEADADAEVGGGADIGNDASIGDAVASGTAAESGSSAGSAAGDSNDAAAALLASIAAAAWAHFVVCITANNHLDDEVQALGAGADLFVSKPAQPSKLKAIMAEVVARAASDEAAAKAAERAAQSGGDAERGD